MASAEKCVFEGHGFLLLLCLSNVSTERESNAILEAILAQTKIENKQKNWQSVSKSFEFMAFRKLIFDFDWMKNDKGIDICIENKIKKSPSLVFRFFNLVSKHKITSNQRRNLQNLANFMNIQQ